jgi:hypothetical protein
MVTVKASLVSGGFSGKITIQVDYGVGGGMGVWEEKK